MLEAFLKFNLALMAQPARVQLWVMVLMAANLLAPLAFLDRIEARLTLGAFLLGMVAMTAITRASGFSRLLGLGHALWLPLVAWLVTRLDEVPAVDAYGYWLRTLILLNGVSLVIDAVDVGRWIRGERGEMTPDGEGSRSSSQLSPSK